GVLRSGPGGTPGLLGEPGQVSIECRNHRGDGAGGAAQDRTHPTVRLLVRSADRWVLRWGRDVSPPARLCGLLVEGVAQTDPLGHVPPNRWCRERAAAEVDARPWRRPRRGRGRARRRGGGSRRL